MNSSGSQSSNKLANAILFPVVGIVLLAILVTGVLIFLTFRSADDSALRNESNLILGSLALQLDLLAKEQESAAVSDAAYFNTRTISPDPTWLHVNIGQRLHQNYGHDQTLIIGETRAPIYFSNQGRLTVNFQDQAFLDEIFPLIARTRARFINRFEKLQSGYFGFKIPNNGLAHSIHEVGYASVNGVPALVSVTAVSPELHEVVRRKHAPAVLVSVKMLTNDRLEMVSKMAGVQGLRLAAQKAGPSKDAQLGLKAPTSAMVGELTWNPRYPGMVILGRLTPLLMFLLLAVAVLTTAVLLYTRHNTQRLAESEARAKHAARHDGLTGLANRDFFANLFDDLLNSFDETEGMLGVLYIDLDHFKDINDTLGHAAGDDVIREAARRLKLLVPRDAHLARISGDEFALLVPDCGSREDLESLLKRVQNQFSAPIYASENHLYVSLSVGAAMAPDDGLSMGELLRKADIALYAAKSNGRGRWAFFDASMEEQVRARESLARELRQAIDRDQLSLVYQPQTSINGRKVLAVEALVRWNHPVRGPLSPGAFIPIAEETGLINDLGMWVLKRACEDAAKWPHLKLSVNVSPIQFRHPQFIERLSSILGMTRLNPHRLEVEVTESVFSNKDRTVLETLQKVHEMGVRVALDDFGAGYSSLSYLRQFPFDTLKIDRGFIAGLESSPHATAILGTIINLGEALGMSVVAEGIETEQQAAFLRLTKCDRLQGFYLSRPVPADEIRDVEHRLAQLDQLQSVSRRFG
ncbi:bifunctional diguanylate cyclase/phosphodiesterase [Stappia sp. F7233]|uniref:Bifunctional diguanylate cyclase/phosphodiesterase n=1 Tax=Stappia albiluteola TaxID=2758565 RepID=A0A839AD04_9HYPH|nr:bifunctional diguanylate cyclase/phosphodiesterase [Stappia albiluteola]MBA5777640.1 bifunctional diguanylate cyclase/phosphodiesterase [Stappia albiluteola]